MHLKPLRYALFFFVLLLVDSIGVRAAEPSPEDTAFVNKLINAVEKSDYDTFIADGEPGFKQVNKEQFEVLAIKLAKKLASGYHVSYLGDMMQKGKKVTLWKITFQDGSDDALASLKIKDGKVLSFFVRN